MVCTSPIDKWCKILAIKTLTEVNSLTEVALVEQNLTEVNLVR